MSGAANRNRGANAERAVVQWLRDTGWAPNARRYLAGDGRQPGDIDGVPWLVEVRDRKRSAWRGWCAETARLAESLCVPWVVVRRTRGVPDVAQWPCVATWQAVGLDSPGTPSEHSMVTALNRSEALGGWVATMENGVYAGRFEWLDFAGDRSRVTDPLRESEVG